MFQLRSVGVAVPRVLGLAGLQTRSATTRRAGIISTPARQRITTMEFLAHATVIAVAVWAIPTWVMVSMKNLNAARK